jgi:class 3 adenylate cyclase
LIAVIAAHGATVPAPVAAVTSAPVLAHVPAPVQTDAERRQLTVMFCDLVGSTALSARFDPEDLREQIGDYDRAVSETVDDFDGFVAKYLGDGVLVYSANVSSSRGIAGAMALCCTWAVHPGQVQHTRSVFQPDTTRRLR